MAFAGTKEKCKACGKTVYVVDQLSADGALFHRACFRCHHCNGTLKLSNYSSLDGTLYCVPKAPKHADAASENDVSTPTKFSSIFLGTQEKCVACGKTVYPIEKVAVDGLSYHRPCFKCSHGGCTISPQNYVAHEGQLYCRHHHAQLFKEKGDFSQLTKARPSKTVVEDNTDSTAVEL